MKFSAFSNSYTFAIHEKFYYSLDGVKYLEIDTDGTPAVNWRMGASINLRVELVSGPNSNVVKNFKELAERGVELSFRIRAKAIRPFTTHEDHMINMGTYVINPDSIYFPINIDGVFPASKLWGAVKIEALLVVSSSTCREYVKDQIIWRSREPGHLLLAGKAADFAVQYFSFKDSNLSQYQGCLYYIKHPVGTVDLKDDFYDLYGVMLNYDHPLSDILAKDNDSLDKVSNEMKTSLLDWLSLELYRVIVRDAVATEERRKELCGLVSKDILTEDTSIGVAYCTIITELFHDELMGNKITFSGLLERLHNEDSYMDYQLQKRILGR